jgi:hypothetical protein
LAPALGFDLMSCNVYVVCEDHTLDQYTVVPVVKEMMRSLGKPNATVRAVTNPRLQGISQVETLFDSLATRYAAIGDVVIFALDRDAEDGRRGRSDRAAKFRAKVSALPASISRKVKVVLAVEETEVWALWGSRSRIAATWADVRRERDSKERYFDPLTTTADMRLPGAGRERLVRLSTDNGWGSLSSGCPELAELASDVRAVL